MVSGSLGPGRNQLVGGGAGGWAGERGDPRGCDRGGTGGTQRWSPGPGGATSIVAARALSGRPTSSRAGGE